MKKTRKKLPEIKSFFENASRVMTRANIEGHMNLNRVAWELPESITVQKFIAFLIDNIGLKELRFSFPSRNIIRYSLGEASIFELVLSLKPNAYFSHYTAMFLHDLTEQIPNTIYLNFEQPPKIRQEGNLEQNRIDLAFKKRPRQSNNIAEFDGKKVCILNGMHTGSLSVIDMEVGASLLPITDIERTLIDIVVRPNYSGGVFEVLNAYRSASERVSVNKLSAVLKQLNYIYPYHQAVGFYLERTGKYSETQINLMRKFEIKYDFYLTYQMHEMEYSKTWKLYFPKGF
ncbi:MAG: hypothetical protein QY316_11135 [Thermodesulfobacteriota bacterium]|nr:MAG: hypothetical protein QY316_11135 [Thermodesulfobacteriota bacterium]